MVGFFMFGKAMNILFKLAGVAMTVGLAACQTTAPSRVPPQPVDPGPPAAAAPAATGQRVAPAASAAASRQQSAAVITLHLAQARQEPSLVAVNVGGKAPLYALPQPVLTQADLKRVTPVTAQDNRSFIMLEMNEQGAPKLRSITEQAKGHYLLLSVQGNLVSLAQVGETISDGRLLVGTQSPAHTQAIIKMMQGR